jgi:Predicted membrane protein
LKQFFKNIVSLYKIIIKFITVDIWNININDIRGAKAKLIRYLKVALLTAKQSGNDKLGLYAVSLSYFTALSIVPFVAAAFVVTGGFGLEKRLQELLLESFVENQETLKWIIEFARNIIKSSEKGLFGIISFLCFIWLIVWLILNVEKCFNSIWKVEKSRSFTKRAAYYFGFIIIAPLVITIFLSVSLVFNNALTSIGQGIGLKHFESISFVLQWAVFYGVVVVALFAMYKLIPNVKVNIVSAFNSSLITSIAFIIVQYLYLETQLMVSRLNAVYGAFAAIPLFLIWLNISWTIILIGAEISYAFQYIRENSDSHESDEQINSRIIENLNEIKDKS